MKIEQHEAQLTYMVIPFDVKPNEKDLENPQVLVDAMNRSHTFMTLESAKDSARFLLMIGVCSYCMIDLVITVMDENSILPHVLDEITVSEMEIFDD